jgi:hypothetical protein
MTRTRQQQARIKLALIPVLALTLVYLLTSSRSSDDTVPAETALVSAPPETSPLATPSAAGAVVTDVVATAPDLPLSLEWPVLPLDDVLAYNPFGWPDGLAPVAPIPVANAAAGQGASDVDQHQMDRQKLLDQLEATSVSAYYVSNQGAVALVGSRLLHVGDVIDGQIRVQEIEPDRVTYEPVAP